MVDIYMQYMHILAIGCALSQAHRENPGMRFAFIAKVLKVLARPVPVTVTRTEQAH